MFLQRPTMDTETPILRLPSRRSFLAVSQQDRPRLQLRLELPAFVVTRASTIPMLVACVA